jgi:hypothetical protein
LNKLVLSKITSPNNTYNVKTVILNTSFGLDSTIKASSRNSTIFFDFRSTPPDKAVIDVKILNWRRNPLERKKEREKIDKFVSENGPYWTDVEVAKLDLSAKFNRKKLGRSSDELWYIYKIYIWYIYKIYIGYIYKIYIWYIYKIYIWYIYKIYIWYIYKSFL